ncbi:MAG: hypothetical protein ACRECO_15525 [Xanthobacteraceae bacterium]
MNEIYCHPLDRPERALVGLYPLLTFVHGAAAAWAAILLATPVIIIILIQLQSYDVLVSRILPIFIFTIPVGLLSFFTYGIAILHINRAASCIFAIIFGLCATSQVAFFWQGLLRHSDMTSALLSALAGGLSVWLVGSMVSGLIRLGRLSALDRGLLRAPFDGIVNKIALQYFCGLPPITKFVRGFRGAKTRLLILASSICFSFAFTTWTFDLIAIKNITVPIDQLSVLAKTLILTTVLIAAANWLLRRGQRNIRFSIEAITAVDPRAPILFLRAFRDDQVTLPPPRYTLLGRLLAIATPRQSLDHLLLTEGTLYGPMVALGNPTDSMPPYGAARGFVTNEHWQSAVMQFARASLAIVITVDDTDSIWWEIEHLAAHNHLDKTLFLVHPRFRSVPKNLGIIGRTLATLSLSPQLEQRTRDAFQTGDVVGFFFDRNGNLCVGKSRRFTIFSYLLMIRWFLRHKFGFGLTLDASRGDHQRALSRARNDRHQP